MTAVLAFGFTFTSAAHAGADAGQESDFAARVNALRASRGLNALVVDQGISATARNWAARIAANGALSHNPNLANELPPNWMDMGENVAFGPDVATMERELENDPPHLANLTNPRFTHLGIGIVEVNGRLWGVQDFAGYGGAQPSYSPASYAPASYAPASYGQPSYAPPPPSVTPTAPPTTTPAPAITTAAATAPVAVPAAATPTATAATPASGRVAFTGSRVEDHVRWAGAALAIGLILLTVRGLFDVRPAAR